MSTKLAEQELRSLADKGARELDGASALELLQWTEDNFGTDFIVASNMQDGVLVHLATQVHPGVDVLFLETGYHFAETIGTRDAVEAVYGVNIINAQSENSVADQDRLLGKDLFARDPGECCRLRKVVPLQNTLKDYSAWVTSSILLSRKGIRQSDAHHAH